MEDRQLKASMLGAEQWGSTGCWGLVERRFITHEGEATPWGFLIVNGIESAICGVKDWAVGTRASLKQEDPKSLVVWGRCFMHSHWL